MRNVEFEVRMTALHPSSMLSHNRELSRLITAAVVNQKFCTLLLTNPAMALATGYNGELFRLATEEQELILSIRATSLADFATQLARNRNGNGHSHGLNGHRNGVKRKAFRLE